ncbi:DUF2637 domain-containing protein [Kitasatospora xanthocidica]|uniref:DUF2637 domain-containing protein n=1 Tax=Kitasatospora xanthocidica TaxID=83382 RepID=UPI00216B3906|nr:DUF2637 domain-containing protein [Kitasatospora xanthocidica]
MYDQGNQETKNSFTYRGLSTWVKGAIVLIGLGAAGIAGIGFYGSYGALKALGEKYELGDFAYVFPIGIDCGIVVLLALDIVLTALRMPYPAFRQVAWLLTVATISFNAASAYPNAMGMAIHAVIPALFVVIVEGARFVIARIAQLQAGAPPMEGIRASRWLLSLVPTFKVWRKMRLWEITSYDEAVELESRRMVFQAILRREFGRNWRRKAPAAAKLPLRLATYGRELPLLEAPLVPQIAKYQTIEVEQASAAEQPELPAGGNLSGLTPELVAELLDLVEERKAAAEPVPAEEEPAEPVELVETELEQPEPTVEQPIAPYGGMVPLRKLERPVPTSEADSPWFRPEQTDPASALWDVASARVFDREAAERPSAAELTRPTSVHARLPHQDTVPAPAVEQLPAEPVAPWSPPVQPSAEPAGPVAGQPPAEPVVAWSPPVQPAVEPTPGVEQAAAPSVQAEHGNQQPEGDLQLKDDQEEEPETPALSGKEQLLKLLQSLTPEQKAMNQKELAAELFPQLSSVMSSQDSVRVYIGRYMREGKI